MLKFNNLNVAKDAISCIKAFDSAKVNGKIKQWAKHSADAMDESIHDNICASALLSCFPFNVDTDTSDFKACNSLNESNRTLTVNCFKMLNSIYKTSMDNIKRFSKADTSYINDKANDNNKVAIHELKLAKVEALN